MNSQLHTKIPLLDADPLPLQRAIVVPLERVHVIDDHAGGIDGIGAVLNEYGYRAEIWSSASTFLREASAHASGCVVMDWCAVSLQDHAPDQDLIALPRRFSTVAVTRCGQLACAVRAMRAGVLDVLAMPVDPHVLTRAIEHALLDSRERRWRAAADQDARALIATLSGREREVLVGLIEGGSNKSLARDLSISARTVEVHRARLMTKLGASSLAQAIRIALRGGVC